MICTHASKIGKQILKQNCVCVAWEGNFMHENEMKWIHTNSVAVPKATLGTYEAATELSKAKSKEFKPIYMKQEPYGCIRARERTWRAFTFGGKQIITIQGVCLPDRLGE